MYSLCGHIHDRVANDFTVSAPVAVIVNRLEKWQFIVEKIEGNMTCASRGLVGDGRVGVRFDFSFGAVWDVDSDVVDLSASITRSQFALASEAFSGPTRRHDVGAPLHYFIFSINFAILHFLMEEVGNMYHGTFFHQRHACNSRIVHALLYCLLAVHACTTSVKACCKDANVGVL